ncbi:cysteine desulfurase [Candidatus Micrarchaeota archaeon]|nr:cysteine desulfurase [Candidatus Micrarchaeota archaeon]
MRLINMNREDFKILERVTYLDSACMSLKPKSVVAKMNEYYSDYPACGGRSHHKLAERVAKETDAARKNVQKLVGAKRPEEIIFTRNTTEAINLIANVFPLQKGDVVLTSDKEHNSNLLPWQLLSERRGVKHEIVSTDGDFAENFEKKITKNVKLVSLVHTSNVDGTTLPVEKVIKISHDYGAKVLLDAAQSAPHREINVRKLDVDFIAASGHKMLGPTGVGFLYGKYNELDVLPQFMVGGETVKNTTYETRVVEDLPLRFEAGLQDYAGIIGLGEAVNYLARVGMSKIERNDYELNKMITDTLVSHGAEILGPKDAASRSSIASFNFKNKDAHQIAMLMDSIGNVELRSGMHCVHSWFNARKIKGSVRASTYLYNEKADAEKFAETLGKVLKITG